MLNDTETQIHFSQRVSDLYSKNILQFDMNYQALHKLVSDMKSVAFAGLGGTLAPGDS